MRDSVKHLSKGVAIYGAGDAAIQIVNLLLISVYVKGGFLREADYGALAIIIAVETFAKILSRWGLDGAFMRFFLDRPTGGPLEQLTSTLVWFIVAADVTIFGAALAVSGPIGGRFLPSANYVTALRLMLINTFLISLTFVPFHVMRMRNQAVTYSALAFTRSVGTVVLRVALVIGLKWSVAGMYAADLLMTLILLPILWRWMRPLLSLRFSRADLQLALRFGLPRVPHGLAQQALDAGNKLLLNAYIPLSQLGVYQNGVTLGTGIRFFTSAFETAWAPFYYATARQADGPTTFGKMTTYGVAALVLLVAVTSAVARDAILVLLSPRYLDASRVIPIIATGIALQGVYLLTSIGLNLTSRTQYYPVATFAALAVGLGLGLVLMPRFGVTGAALAFLCSTITQTVVAFLFARRFYPIPYEPGRLARVVLSGMAAGAAGAWLVPALPPLAGLFARGAATVAVFAGLLAASGFFRRTERAFLSETIARLRRRMAARPAASDGT